MNDLTNHGVPRAFQLLWRRRPRVAAASWCKRRYGREREWRSRVGLTECGSGTSVDKIRFSQRWLLICESMYINTLLYCIYVHIAWYEDNTAVNKSIPSQTEPVLDSPLSSGLDKTVP